MTTKKKPQRRRPPRKDIFEYWKLTNDAESSMTVAVKLLKAAVGLVCLEDWQGSLELVQKANSLMSDATDTVQKVIEHPLTKERKR